MERERDHSTYEDDTIDLFELLMALKRKLWLIILAAVLGGGLFGVYSYYIPIPQYTSSAMLYILSKETTLTSLADLQIGSQLSEDYKVIILTRPLLQDVIEQLDLDMGYRQLRSRITITDSSERILTLTVTDADPRRAMQIVNQLAASASDYIGDIVEMIPPKIIEEGVVNVQPVSPNIEKNIVIGAMLGMLFICGIVTVRFLLNDTVQTEEDVERYLGLTVLASVPERGAKGGKSGRRKKSRHSRKMDKLDKKEKRAARRARKKRRGGKES